MEVLARCRLDWAKATFAPEPPSVQRFMAHWTAATKYRFAGQPVAADVQSAHYDA